MLVYTNMTFLFSEVLKENLNMQNYKRKFSLMLYVEELQSKINIRAYDLHDVTVRPHGSHRFILNVGLVHLHQNIAQWSAIVA